MSAQEKFIPVLLLLLGSSSFHYESSTSSSLQPCTNVLTPGFNLEFAPGRVTGNLPDLRFFPGGVQSDSLRAGRRLPPPCDWCNLETPPPGAAPRPPVGGRPRGLCKLPPPRPAPGLDAFVCRSTRKPPRAGRRQVRSGEGLAVVGAGSGPSLGLSFSVGGMGGEGEPAPMGLGPRGRC